MQKIKFDFEATKERIYAPNSNVPIGAPVDRNGNIANDGNAYGIVLCKETENEKYWVKYNLVVMVAGYCDIIDAQEIWGDEYSAEAIAAMSDIVFCDDHKIGGGWPADLPKPSVGGYGYTESGEQTVIVDNESVPTTKAEVVNYATGVFIETVVLEVGSNYSVIFNDSEYVVTGEDFGGGGGASVGAKVTSEGADFSVYPFAVIYVEGSTSILATQSGGTYTVTIKKSSDTIHKIDEKYLPVIPTAPSDDGTYTLTCTVTDGEPAYSWESTT